MCETSTSSLRVDVGKTKKGLPKSSSGDQAENQRLKSRKNRSGF